MGRISVVEHQGKRILVQDFSGLRPGDEYRRSLEEARAYIASQEKASVLSLFDATGTMYDTAIIADLKHFTTHNKPYMRASAVVGVEGLLSVALMAVSRFSGRVFKTFKDRASAMDWLAEHP